MVLVDPGEQLARVVASPVGSGVPSVTIPLGVIVTRWVALSCLGCKSVWLAEPSPFAIRAAALQPPKPESVLAKADLLVLALLADKFTLPDTPSSLNPLVASTVWSSAALIEIIASRIPAAPSVWPK